jgi:hypothetical protein
MPQIPQYNEHVGLSGGLLGPEPTGLGEDRARVAESVVGLVDSIKGFQARKQMAGVADRLSELRLASEERYATAQQNAVGGADGFADDSLKGFDELRTEIAKKIPDRAAREVFVEHADRDMRSALELRSVQYQGDRAAAFRDDQANRSLNRTLSAVELNPDSWVAAGAEHHFMLEQHGGTPAEVAARSQRDADSIAAAAALGVAKQNPVSALAKLSSTNSGDSRFDTLPIDRRHDVERVAKAYLVDQKAAAVVSAYERSPRAGLEAITTLAKSGIAPDLLADIGGQVNARLSQLRTVRRQEHEDEIVGLERAIATDNAGAAAEATADRLYQVGAYTVDEYAAARASIDRSRIQAAKSNAGAVEIATALAAGLPLDPKDPDQRKALDAYFRAGVVNNELGSEPWRASALAVAQKTRTLPDSALAWTRQALRSPNPEVAANAAQFFGATKLQAPDALSELDDSTKTFGSMVNSMIESGTPPAQAVQAARANVFEVAPQAIENRKHAWSSAGDASLIKTQPAALDSYIDRDFDHSVFSSQPASTDPRLARVAGAKQLLPDFTAQTERYFLKSGDIALARDLAWSDLKRVYGVSQVNGAPEMFAFPPEHFGVDPKDVRAEIETFLKATPQPDRSKTEDVVLVPDASTLRQVSDAFSGQAIRPSYLLVGKTGDPIVDAAGIPKRYTIPSGEQITARILAAQAAAIGKAKAARDAYRRGLELAQQKSNAH